MRTSQIVRQFCSEIQRPPSRSREGDHGARDTAPPLTNQQDAFQVGYDPTYVDPRGKTFYAAVRYAFK